MDKLENDINELINDINQNWGKRLLEKIKGSGTIEVEDIISIMNEYSNLVAKKEKAFQDAKIRLNNKKKGGLFS